MGHRLARQAADPSSPCAQSNAVTFQLLPGMGFLTQNSQTQHVQSKEHRWSERATGEGPSTTSAPTSHDKEKVAVDVRGKNEAKAAAVINPAHAVDTGENAVREVTLIEDLHMAVTTSVASKALRAAEADAKLALHIDVAEDRHEATEDSRNGGLQGNKVETEQVDLDASSLTTLVDGDAPGLATNTVSIGVPTYCVAKYRG